MTTPFKALKYVLLSLTLLFVVVQSMRYSQVSFGIGGSRNSCCGGPEWRRKWQQSYARHVTELSFITS